MENVIMGVKNLTDEYDQLPTSDEQPRQDIPFFIVKPANDVLADAASQEPPKPLWLSLWYEGEICCLFADSGSGKSIYAVQIGAAVAQTRKVMYFDFELSDKQFAERYTDEWSSYTFPPNFMRVYINPEYLATKGMADVIGEIEDATFNNGADTIIIDNLTWVATATEKAEDAGRIMQRFMRLKKVYGWSILILAHTPKKEKQQPRTENDLAGSKVLFNFLDAAFSIGQSQRGDNYRYIIELKTRMGARTYGRSNVIVTQIVKENAMTYHKTIGYSSESLELENNRNEPSNNELRAIFANIVGNRTMRYTDLVAGFVAQAKKSNGDCYGKDSAKKKVKKALENEILVQDDDGNYRLGVKV